MVFSNDQKFELVKLLLSNGLTPSLVVSQIRQIELGLQPGFQDLSNEGKASLGQISVSVNAVAPESLQKALESYRGALSTIYNSQSNSSFVNGLNALCHKHGVYLANVEGKQGLSVLPIEPHMHSSGYVAQPDGQIDFDWH